MSEEKKEVLNIYQKLLEVRKSVDSLWKKESASVRTKSGAQYSYKYVSSTIVLKSIRGKMNEQGLLLKPDIIDYLGNGKIKMTYTWINVDNPTETLVSNWLAIGNEDNNIEQALGRALTYTEKYFILKFYQIPTDKDDPDMEKNVRNANKLIAVDIDKLTFEKSREIIKKTDEKTKKEIQTKIFEPFKKLREKHSIPKDYLKMTINDYIDYCAKEDEENKKMEVEK